MDARSRQALTAALRSHVAKVAADLRAQMSAPGPVRDRALALHGEERVGEAFDVWTDLLSRRAAVLWVLKSVYVRVLEDRGLVSPARIVDRDAQQLFERLAPNLGETSFLRWIYRDLASPQGGLPELFGWQPAEFAWPSDALSRELLEFWRHEDPDTKARWSFANERFDGELMGDLYQELDPVAKDRYALCQTPDFVREFILDRTLTPAIEEFGADIVRLIDPACGSGHFLIDGLKRIVEATRAQHPDWAPLDLVKHCLNRVVGIDLNDYACALARARLVMTAAELAGLRTLAQDSVLHPHVYWADGLEQVELKDNLFGERGDHPTRASLTRTDTRRALGAILLAGFHVAIANPPYITEADPSAKAYHKERIQGRQRYLSAHQQYSLGGPFIERLFELSRPDAYVAVITSHSFSKRDFGRPLVEDVLPSYDLTLVVDASHVDIPHHDTPAVLLFARTRAPVGDTVRTVVSLRSDTNAAGDGTVVDGGPPWQSLQAASLVDDFGDAWASTLVVPRSTLRKHPWSLAGGTTAGLKSHLESAGTLTLADVLTDIGRTTSCGEDDIYLLDARQARRRQAQDILAPMISGDRVRDWRIVELEHVLSPYLAIDGPAISASHPAVVNHFWPFRTILRSRTIFGRTLEERGQAWFEHLERYVERLQHARVLTYASIATHNHFTLVGHGHLFKSTSPMLHPKEQFGDTQYLCLLAILNSSLFCFWMKQVFYPKGSASKDLGELSPEKNRFAIGSNGLVRFPLPTDWHSPRLAALAQTLVDAAVARSRCEPIAVLDDQQGWGDSTSLRAALEAAAESDRCLAGRMAALQEEIDWYCYYLYGLCVDTSHDGQAAAVELHHRPFAWPAGKCPPDVPAALREHYAERAALSAQSPSLGEIESAVYKRPWRGKQGIFGRYARTYEERSQVALWSWLGDRLEDIVAAQPGVLTPARLTASAQGEPRLLAAIEVLLQRRDFALDGFVADHLGGEAVPSHPHHVYSDVGQVKRAAWERTWEAQRQEDAGNHMTPAIPPRYAAADFVRPDYFGHRGKLDVPKERFIAFTEVPGRSGDRLLYGWAGWTPLQRVRALLAMDEELEDAGVPLADRVGVLDSAWRLLPDVAREDAAAAGRLKAELQAIIGQAGPTPEMLADWKARFPPPSRSGGTKRASRKRKTVDDDDSTETSD